MQKNMMRFSFLILLMSSSFVFADKTDKKKTTVEYSEIIVLDKGIKRTIKVKKPDVQKSSVSTLSMKEEALSKKGLIVAFDSFSEEELAAFETKYGLKFKKKLVTGYYIFQNVSDKDDVEIVSSIIKNEKNVKTVKPNWKKNNQPR